MTITDGTVTEPAFAKINLSLHVTGQRADGYHLLDSLVMFTALGDLISVQASEKMSLTIDGPFAKGLSAGEDNLVMRAARLFDTELKAQITLTKNLPVASGIGGGSADAAAALRALSKLWSLPLPSLEKQVKLGADIPVCISPSLTRMRGIGDILDPLGAPPKLDMILVNPRVGVATSAVFGGLASKSNAPMSDDMRDPFDRGDWVEWLSKQRNDLEQPARQIAPEIDAVITALTAQDGCMLARMSGSGATCFAFFDNAAKRDTAADQLRATNPDWWVETTGVAPT